MKSVKINKIGFKNYKVFDDVRINLNQCNVFVGPNSSGKSSIAEFLVFFRELIRLFSGKEAKLDFNYLLNFLNNAFKIGKNQPLTFETEVTIGNYSFNYFAEFFTRYDTDAVWANERLVITQIRNKYIILEASMNIIKDDFPKLEGIMKFKGKNIDEENNHGGSITYITSSILRYENFKKFEKKILNLINEFYEYWDKIRLYDFNIYDKKEISKKSGISNEIILTEDFQNLLKVLLNLSFQQKEIFTEIKDWLIQLIPDFKDFIIQTSTNKGDAYIAFSEEMWNTYSPLTQASDGIIRLLCILTILFNKEKPNLIILDEPENGIHPSIRNYVADFAIAASDDAQIMFLTHDSESLRQFELEMIYYFKRKHGATEVKQLSDVKSLTETMKALKDIEKNTVVSTHLSDSL
jgi:predicted ATPase